MRQPRQPSRAILRAALLAALVAAGGERSAAQERPGGRLSEGSISGIILDATTSDPLAGATVIVEPATQGALPGQAPASGGFVQASRGTLTDSLGRYHFEGLAPGRYRLHITRTGYRAASVGVELHGAADSRLSIGLAVEPVALEAVEVVADRPQPFGRDRSPRAEEGGSRIAAARERQRAHLSADARELTHADVVEAVTLGETDLFRALQRLPGVSTRDDFTAELWVRGASWDQTRVLFDGLPLFHPVHGMGLFSGVSPDAIGAAVLHAGARPASLGEGAAGVLDLASRRGGGSGELRGTADLSLASARLALDQRVLDGRGAWMVAARRTYLDWLTGSIAALAGDPELEVPYAFSDLAARLDLQLREGRALEASALLERDRVSDDIPDVLHGTSAAWGNSAARVSYLAPLAGVRARHTLGVSRYAAEAREREADPDLPYSAPSEPHSDNHLLHLRASGELSGDPSPAGSTPWRVGYEVVRQGARYRGPPPRPYAGEAADSAPLDRESSLVHAGVWGERRWGSGAGLEVEAGLRLEAGPAVAGAGTLRLAPRLSARYPLSPAVSVTAAAGRSFQYAQALAPVGPAVHRNFSASQLWLLADSGTPAIRADVASLGAEGWLGSSWLATASVYLRRAAGITLPDPRPGLLAGRPLFVQGENTARGLDLSARRLAGRWTAAVAYSYGVSEMEAAGLRFPAPADRRHTLDATAMARLTRRVRLGAAYGAASGAPYTRVYRAEWSCAGVPGCDERARLADPGSLRTPAYASLDLLLDWTGSLRGWEVGAYLQLRNALGRDNATTYEYTSQVCPGLGFTGQCPTPYEYVDRFQTGVPTLPVLGVRVRF